jgi:hypothetical protein
MTDTIENNQASKTRKSLIVTCLLLATLSSAYLFGAYSYPRDLFPINLIKAAKRFISPSVATPSPVETSSSVTAPPPVVNKFDSFGRLVFSSEKIEVSCPIQNQETAVIVAIGQSNSANSSLSKITPKFGEKIYNYYDGKCFKAVSPLLGATGDGGEFITPLADKLIEANIYKTVVIVSSGIGGTTISRWQKDGDLNAMLLQTVLQLIKTYKPTHIVWHQGEGDFNNKTSAKVYVSSFLSLKKSLNDINVKAPFFIAIATQCNQPDWTLNNPTSNGQKALLQFNNIFLGANTDILLGDSDRAPDKCHLSESGLYKTAYSYAEAIIKSKNTKLTQ